MFSSKKFIYYSSICIHVVEYVATSTKIPFNVAKFLGIFYPHYQKMLKNIASCSQAHAHKLTFTFIGSQYNVIVIKLNLFDPKLN